MSDLSTNESWQVEVNGQVYEAQFDELATWINDGALQPEDMVRRGNLRWIEAQKVPALLRFFNAKANGETIEAAPMPTVVVTTPSVVVTTITEPIARSGACSNHPDREAKFLCLTCLMESCRECVKSFGSSVTVCSTCGGMCKPKADIESQRQANDFRHASVVAGFGFSDLGEAIAYPFKFKTSLFIGAVMFMFFSLGRSASAFGGIQMFAASLISMMLANMLAFGVLSNVVESFSQGKIGGNFMPAFEDFSIWDDVLHPFFVYIGSLLSSFGAFALLLLVGVYFVMSTVASQMDTVKTNLERTPGTPYYGVRDTFDQSNQVKGVLNQTEKMNNQRLETQESLEHGDAPPAADSEEEIQNINKMIADNKKQELESVLGKSPETRERESAAMIAGFLKLAAPIVVIGFITFIWGLFYFPAACIVAGYTRSFVAAINPLVGLDTIKRMGADYFKIFLMELLILGVFIAVGAVISIIFSAFDMPGIGNLPAMAIQSMFWFYLVIVFACVLGFAMFKAGDRLKLHS